MMQQINGSNDYAMVRKFLSGVIIDSSDPIKVAMALAAAIEDIVSPCGQTDRLAVAGVLMQVARDVAADAREVRAN